jgi:hypothetical protein
MPLAFTISDLRQQPEFFDSVADRIWQAWWEPNGYPIDFIRGRLEEKPRCGSRRLREGMASVHRWSMPPRAPASRSALGAPISPHDRG